MFIMKYPNQSVFLDFDPEMTLNRPQVPTPRSNDQTKARFGILIKFGIITIKKIFGFASKILNAFTLDMNKIDLRMKMQAS